MAAPAGLWAAERDVETNLFYMDIENLSETIVKSFTFSPPLLTLTFDNNDKAVARGNEVKWSYRWSGKRSVYANYTYESISTAKAITNTALGDKRTLYPQYGGHWRSNPIGGWTDVWPPGPALSFSWPART